MAVFVSIIWGLLLITIVSVMIAKWRNESCWLQIGEHLGIALVVIVATYYLGVFVDSIFGAMTI
jgi:VIT1/CCC1 family predicted Fe2+/Mn2+ transporter